MTIIQKDNNDLYKDKLQHTLPFVVGRTYTTLPV